VAEDAGHAIEDPRGSGARRWQGGTSGHTASSLYKSGCVPDVGPTVRPFCENLPRRATNFPSIEERSSVPPESISTVAAPHWSDLAVLQCSELQRPPELNS